MIVFRFKVDNIFEFTEQLLNDLYFFHDIGEN